MQLTWLASVSTSAMHAAGALIAGHTLADTALQEALSTPADNLRRQLAGMGLDPSTGVAELTALASGIENNLELARVAVTKLQGAAAAQSSAAARLAGCVADLETAFCHCKPNAVDELALRARPLRELFEAHGPGLLKRIDALVDEPLIAPSAQVILVQPALGGDAVAHLRYNSVRIEAVLTNVNESLPEVVRLAWALAQLQCDLPAYSDHIGPGKLARVAALALVPPTLSAAAHVDLVTESEAALPGALSAWHLAPSPQDAAHIAASVRDWWTAYSATPTPWAIALAALDQLLARH